MTSPRVKSRGGAILSPKLAPFAPLVLLALLLTLVAELIGPHTVDLGIGTVSLYPLVWGILLGGALSFQKVRPLSPRIQHYATYMVEIAVLLLGARLSFLVGGNIKVLFEAGPALLLQEIGHLLGTVLFSLPVAVALKMGRSTVGACFSIDREGSFAMVSDKYGPDSDEYRGVLSMYVFGTLVGALYVGLLSSLLAGWHVFNPLALAMGAGVGSGSMMAASSASIAAEHPEMAEQILAVATVSNLITTVLGLYVGMYAALPLAERFYRVLTRNQPIVDPAPVATPATVSKAAAHPVDDRPSLFVSLPLVVTAMVISQVVFHQSFDPKLLVGFAFITAVVLVSLALKHWARLSPIIGLSTIGLLLGSPWSPVSAELTSLLQPIEFLPLTTPVLVLAGLGLGKDEALLKRIGWRIIPVGLVSLTASFVVSATIAQVVGVG
ncbi:MAG TPA: DUF3100 domain-containing protein [Nocardioidaceae bacterium]|nr:DUF3100 domain-containing protein [Nocardioidaceae bacterium]